MRNFSYDSKIWQPVKCDYKKSVIIGQKNSRSSVPYICCCKSFSLFAYCGSASYSTIFQLYSEGKYSYRLQIFDLLQLIPFHIVHGSNFFSFLCSDLKLNYATDWWKIMHIGKLTCFGKCLVCSILSHIISNLQNKKKITHSIKYIQLLQLHLNSIFT